MSVPNGMEVVRGRWSEVGGPGSVVRGRWSEVGGPGSVVRGRWSGGSGGPGGRPRSRGQTGPKTSSIYIWLSLFTLIQSSKYSYM